jgi:hypothetical protein
MSSQNGYVVIAGPNLTLTPPSPWRQNYGADSDQVMIEGVEPIAN